MFPGACVPGAALTPNWPIVFPTQKTWSARIGRCSPEWMFLCQVHWANSLINIGKYYFPVGHLGYYCAPRRATVHGIYQIHLSSKISEHRTSVQQYANTHAWRMAGGDWWTECVRNASWSCVILVTDPTVTMSDLSATLSRSRRCCESLFLHLESEYVFFPFE